jgi:hypothetical protein
MFDEWLAYTRANGISEYLSPTYYATDLNSLLLGYRFASDLAVRDRYEKTLNLFVSDIAADLFVSGGLLGGPHSRDYDFLLGNGSLAVYLYAEGFIEHLNPKSVDLENACILTGLTGAAYHPGEPIYRIANTPERMVVGRCGPMGIGDRYTYVTSDFTLGSAGADYGEQDKLINLMFSSDHPLPAITVVPDIFDAPYGKIMTKDRSGHGKPTHLPLHPALVQDRGTLLAFLDIDPSASKQPSGTLATNIVLPSHVDEIDIDGAPVKVDAPFALPVTLNSVVSLRLGNAFVGIRIFEATGAEGQAASIALVGDIEGMKRGAIRLAVNQYRGAARQFASRHAPVGFLMIARHIATPADATTALTELREATITVNADAHTAHVEAKVGGEAMSVDRNFDTGQTSNKSIAGKPVTFPIVSVNGQDLIASTINP